RKDVAYFDKIGEVTFNSDAPVSFAYTTCHMLRGEDFDAQKLKKTLECYAEENAKRSIPKLFIPTPAYPKRGVPHALLLVVEADPADKATARITLVNSLGSGSYRDFENRLKQIATQVFPSKRTSIVENQVHQQQDGWSCGWQMLENIDLLSKTDNAQAF